MSVHWLRGWLLLALLLMPLGGRAASEGAPKDQMVFPRTAPGASASEPRGESPTSAKALLGLAVLCAMAGGWLLWRRRSSSASAAGSGRKLKIVETQSLGNRQFLVVADYDGRKILLGVCPGRIELLTHLAECDEDEA